MTEDARPLVELVPGTLVRVGAYVTPNQPQRCLFCGWDVFVVVAAAEVRCAECDHAYTVEPSGGIR